MDTISHVKDNIYLSGWNASINPELLADLDIKYILCLNRELKKDNYTGIYDCMDILHKYICIDDSLQSDFFSIIDDIIAFMKGRQGNILVHCTMGMSRSASAVIAYLLYEHYQQEGAQKYALTDIIDFVKERRNIIRPNASFMADLIKYENMFINDIKN